MSKKLGFALSGLMLAMVAGTASADMDGGQINISGLVSDNTCETKVDGGKQDGLVLLQTVTVLIHVKYEKNREDIGLFGIWRD